MSSDEDDEVTGRRKRSALNRSGRNRLRTLADSSDEEEYDEVEEEEELFNEPTVEEREESQGYSSESLKKALIRLKRCMNPPLVFVESKLSTWEGVEREISKHQVKLQNLDELIEDISTSTLLSLEFKCLVSSIAANSCEIYKKDEQTRKCQDFFKSKDKTDKSRHVANFISNKWLKESLKVVRVSKEDTMHMQVLESGLRFIRSAFVIDNTKKLSVLKEKQNIDWETLVEHIVKASKNTPLADAATSTKEHFASFLSPAAKTEEAAASAAPVRKTTIKDMDAKKREERMAKLKRTAQATSIRRNSSTASAGELASQAAPTSWGQPAPATTGSTWGKNPVAAPSSASTWGKPMAAAPGPATWGNSSATAPAPATWGQSAASVPSSSSGKPSWGNPSTETEPAAPATWGQPAAPTPATWGQPAEPESSSASNSTWGQPSAAAPAPATWGQPAEPASSSTSSATWGQPSAAAPAPATWGQPAEPASSSTSSATWGQPSAATPAPATWGQPAEPAAASSNSATWGQPSAPAPAPATWGQSTTASSSAATTDGSWGASNQIPDPPRRVNPKLVGRERGARYDDRYQAKESRGSDSSRNDSSSTYGPGSVDQASQGPPLSTTANHGYSRPNSSDPNSASSTHDQGSAWNGGSEWKGSQSSTSDVGGARGSGGWGTSSSNNVATSHDNQTDAGGGNNYGSESSSQKDDYEEYRKRRQMDNNSSNKRPRNDQNFANPAPTGAGRGRGRGQTLPAWMTQGQASIDDGADPRSYNEGPTGMDPRGGGSDGRPPPSRDNDALSGGRGRGRGRDVNLPAWMTSGGDGPQTAAGGGGVNSYEAPPAGIGGGFSDPGAGGGGRGRGRTLPAWMTQNNTSGSV